MQPQGPFCQSCSMPLSQPELFGTEKDGSKNQKYCIYCYKDGEFTLPEATMEEMIEISAKGWSEQAPDMSYEQAKAFLQQCIPNLERWRK
ncbi:MAG: zinc ribbon domain-containing protein [Candidatus Bathyarchaeota archaeon]